MMNLCLKSVKFISFIHCKSHLHNFIQSEIRAPQSRIYSIGILFRNITIRSKLIAEMFTLMIFSLNLNLFSMKGCNRCQI
jgi:hypothetical protein